MATSDVRRCAWASARVATADSAERQQKPSLMDVRARALGATSTAYETGDDVVGAESGTTTNAAHSLNAASCAGDGCNASATRVSKSLARSFATKIDLECKQTPHDDQLVISCHQPLQEAIPNVPSTRRVKSLDCRKPQEAPLKNRVEGCVLKRCSFLGGNPRGGGCKLLLVGPQGRCAHFGEDEGEPLAAPLAIKTAGVD
jgi:hypothetical protein